MSPVVEMIKLMKALRNRRLPQPLQRLWVYLWCGPHQQLYIPEVLRRTLQFGDSSGTPAAVEPLQSELSEGLVNGAGRKFPAETLFLVS